MKGNVMRARRAAEEIAAEVQEMNMDEHVSKLEVKVDHVQSDVTEIKAEQRDLRGDVKSLRSEMHVMGPELRSAMSAIKVGLEKIKAQIWVALAVIFVMQLLTVGGVPAAIARAFRFP